MNTVRPFCGIALIWAAAFACQAAAEQIDFPSEQHPWGRFPVGSWKVVRTTAQTLDDKGRVTNVAITDTRTALIAADNSSYSLRSDVTLDVLGRRIATAPHVAKYGYYGETPGQAISVKKLGEAGLTIDGRSFNCELRQVSFEGQGGKLVSTLHLNGESSPFVLRRESSNLGDSEEKRNTTLVEVFAIDLPKLVLDRTRLVSYVRTTQNLPQGRKVTVEVHCDDVPGGVVSHSASETELTGRAIRRSTLELIDFGVPSSAGPDVSGGLPRRPHRANKAIRRMDQR